MTKLFYIIVILVLCSSCATVQTPPAPEYSPEALKELMIKVLTNLSKGEVDQAKLSLNELIQHDPDNSEAHDLQMQIEMGPKVYFKNAGWNKRCYYTVRGNDSLSRIAKKYLNDVNKFYGLAKLNGIRVPQNLNRGKRILVPANTCPLNGTEEVVKKTEKVKHKEEKVIPIEEYIKQASDEEALDKLKSARDILETSEQYHHDSQDIQQYKKSLIDQIEARQHLKDGDIFQANKQYLRAVEHYQTAHTLFKDATAHSRSPARIQDELSVLAFYIKKLQTEIQNQANNHFTNAEKLKQNNDSKAINTLTDLEDLEASHEHYQKASQLAPNNSQYQTALRQMSEQLSDNYHRLAIKRYNAKTISSLEEAIAIWDKLLKINPDYQPAVVKRKKAVKLRDAIKGKNS